MTPATYHTALGLYAGALTLWVATERWRLSRITESPFFQLLGVLFTLVHATNVACLAIGAAAALAYLEG